jgi:hypothetical protein
MSKESMKELYSKVDKVKPLAEKDGQLYCTFEDAATMNSYNAQEPKTGMQTRNKDGSLASTGKQVHAVNVDNFYLNRYKLKGKKLHVVSGHTAEGYRCIKEQASGRVFLKNIPVYVLSRDDDKRLVLEKMTTITDTEFISDFTGKLSNAAMAEILPLIAVKDRTYETSELPI